MSQIPVSLIGTLRISFGYQSSINFLRASANTKFGVTRTCHVLSVTPFRKNSTIAITRQKLAELEHQQYSTNFLNAASNYLGKVVYCTEEKITQTVESTPEATLSPSQSFFTDSQTTTTSEKENIISSPSDDKRPFSLTGLFDLSQISFGASMGFASGYFVKKISKTAAFLVGAVFVLLQVLEHQGYIKIHWNKFEENYHKILDLDKDGKVTTNDFKLILHKVATFLSKNFQTDASFIIGFGIGLRYD
ncbi:FUN14 family-domain-containing protein [Rhizophagus clarus]|uniref:FUN14 family-domain-containing protein n=1 Tax=Rhizophagus clarus TaxID=94130 RepID=A0A8H3KYR6_9GLOM|nr:FUN14 family-domain-containing protein [Rhizophagus clarus]